MEQFFVPDDNEDTSISSHLSKHLKRQPSYKPTAWAPINRILDLIDILSNGHADWIQRFVLYAFIGGFAALVNLFVFFIIFHKVSIPLNDEIHDLIAQIFAFEISLLANFIPNDYFTFRHLSGHKRSWFARCGRFHLTSIIGFFLTSLIQFCCTFYLHISPLFSQAIALILVLFYNFTFHHLFTYRHVPATEQAYHEMDALAMPLAIATPEEMEEAFELVPVATGVLSEKNTR